MKVQYLYVPDVLSCRDNDRLSDAAQLLHRAGVGALPVLGDGSELVGILSERDLTRAVADGVDPREAAVGQYASRSVSVATVDEDSADVGQRMLDAGIRHLPVVDGRTVIGMLSMRDLLAVETWV